MDLLRCALGLVPCGRLLPETPYEAVVLLVVVAFSVFELAGLAGLALLPVASVTWGMRAWRRAKEERRCGNKSGGCGRRR
ncbi:MAG: hypothetical protein F4Y94_05845 [Chloroflexi bacterium]|nr:hypothetical protein [Chloroflexota bacterium]MYF39035.1 hypothetical protein [Gammaproteobacteria bacterium]